MEKEVIIALVSGGLGLFGTVFSIVATITANNVRREMQVKLLEPQLGAYRKLWAIMGVASPSLTDELTEGERTVLEGKLRDWYYEEGNGIFMSVESRKRLVDAKKHLLNFEIDSVSIRTELSNLRSQMKNDIGVYGKEDIGLAGEDTPRP